MLGELIPWHGRGFCHPRQKPPSPKNLIPLTVLKVNNNKGADNSGDFVGSQDSLEFFRELWHGCGTLNKKKSEGWHFCKTITKKKLEGSTKFPWGLKSQTMLVRAVTPSPPPFPSILLYAWLPLEQCIQTTLMIIQVAFMTSMYDEAMLPFRKYDTCNGHYWNFKDFNSLVCLSLSCS